MAQHRFLCRLILLAACLVASDLIRADGASHAEHAAEHDHVHSHDLHGHDHSHEDDADAGNHHEEPLKPSEMLEQLATLLRSQATQGHDHHHHHHHGSHDHHATLSTVSIKQLIQDMEAQNADHISQAVSQLMKCAADNHCTIEDPTAEDPSHDDHDDHEGHVTGSSGGSLGLLGLLQPGPGGTVAASTKMAAAFVLFIETIVGMLVPPFVSRMDGHAWWLSLLNSFSGGIFLTAGLMHLVPHCEEAQMEVDLREWHLPAHYPLYLLLICAGYLLVFAVERVAFEGHSHAHSHGDDDDEDDCCSPGLRGIVDPAVSLDSMFLPISKELNRSGVRKRIRRCGSGSYSDDKWSPTQSPSKRTSGTGLGDQQKPEFSVFRGLPLLVGMSVHTFLECLALGLISRHASFMVLLAAIAAHKGVSALALAAKFTKEGASLGQVLLLVGPFTLLAPSAIAAGHWAGAALPPVVQLLLNCLAAGTFLYVGASEILAEEFEGDVRAGRRDISKLTARLIKFVAVLAAVACIAALGLMPHVH